MTRKIFYDKEAKWFYGIELSGCGIAVLAAAINRDYVLTSVFTAATFWFLYFTIPLSAEVISDKAIRFKYPIRSFSISSDNLKRIKARGAYDYRAQLAVYTNNPLRLSYFCRRFNRAPELAQHMLRLIEQAPQAEVTPEAMRLLKQVAGGNKNPLKEEKANVQKRS